MIDDFAKEYLHADLRQVRTTMLWKLEGLTEYDMRRPLTATGTNLLGLIKHLAVTEAWYFGEVFGRPFPGTWHRSDDPAGHAEVMWARRMNLAPRSSTATGERGSTRMRPSPSSTSTRRAMCPGGPGPT